MGGGRGILYVCVDGEGCGGGGGGGGGREGEGQNVLSDLHLGGAEIKIFGAGDGVENI